jgi:transcriptional regulator
MYLPSHFEESRPEVLRDLISAHPLGILITQGANGLDANYLPFELDTAVGAHGVLRAHVPTWNYRVVHAHGTLTVRDDAKYVRGLVARLTRTHENREPKPWKMGDAPPDYIDTMLGSIVGLEIDIHQLVGKFKLSQNREMGDREGAAKQLLNNGNSALGQAMLNVT